MSWDPFQREVLAELGHVVYRQAGIALVADSAAAHIDAPDGGTAGMASNDSPLLDHVARAAGMTTEALQACLGDMQAIAGLRGNASAKRALWPRLRTLRRQAT